MSNFFRKLAADIDRTLNDKSEKLRHDARLFYVASGIIFAVMIGINLWKRQYVMGTAVAVILSIALISLVMSKHEKTFYASLYVFSLSILFFLIYICLNPTGEGFNMLWTLMVPAYGMLFYGRRIGTIFSIALLMIILAVFYLPALAALTDGMYSGAFKFRFPLLFISFIGCSIYTETIAKRTRKKLQEMVEKQDYMSKHDLLTDLLNRQEFVERATKLIDECGRDKAFLFLSIDDLHDLNKRYGNEKGDEILRRVAGIISRQVGDKGLAGRWDGGDFVILLYDWKDCGATGESLCSKARDIWEKGKGEPQISVSVGAYAECGERGLSFEGFLERATDCLKRAKAKGKNRTEIEIDDAGSTD